MVPYAATFMRDYGSPHPYGAICHIGPVLAAFGGGMNASVDASRWASS